MSITTYSRKATRAALGRVPVAARQAPKHSSSSSSSSSMLNCATTSAAGPIMARPRRLASAASRSRSDRRPSRRSTKDEAPKARMVKMADSER
ncbi:hypothetical protein AB0C15_01100 [Micromonospora sp. NPDC048835]|uniref:hypothetical protein n=1 Tax=Micromonospora sp. NPDC048835 TaxID=3155147 RepID=UPI00340B9AD4